MLFKPSKLASPKARAQQLRTTTVRSFDGGLNVIDNDLNMAPKFAKTLDNIERNLDGSLSVRPGTFLFATISGDTTDIVNCYYFNNFLITVSKSGKIAKIDGAGTVTNLTISGATPFSNTTTYASFTVASSDLVICNGIDKPVLISGHPTNANYMLAVRLVDLGSLSNVNTPIGQYVINHAQYTVIAGVSTNPSTIYISSRGTSGTYVGDPAPNDSVAIDLGPRVTMGSATITGIIAYRDKLLVTFERGILPMNLGIYTGSPAVHTPTDDGFIQEFGCLCHRSLVSVGDDTYYCDNIGVNSIERVVLYNTLRPVRASQLVDPLITAMLKNLSAAQISQYVFSVYDMRNKRYMLFVPTLDSNGNLVESVGFSFTNIPIMHVSAWARLRGWKWQSSCRSSLQNIFFTMNNRIYVYDLDAVHGYADLMLNSGASDQGVPISFTWEMPWGDMSKRMNSKDIKYMSLETQGTAEFNAKMYVDHIVTVNGQDMPILTQTFVGGDATGYGNSPYGDSPFGGGRPTSDERLYTWPSKGKIFKLVFSGAVTQPLRFVSISLAWMMSSIRR